jgi:hypothetical protein
MCRLAVLAGPSSAAGNSKENGGGWRKSSGEGGRKREEGRGADGLDSSVYDRLPSLLAGGATHCLQFVVYPPVCSRCACIIYPVPDHQCNWHMNIRIPPQ